MADALASGASVLRDVGVQVPLRPQRAVLRDCDTEVTILIDEVVASVFVTARFVGLLFPGEWRVYPPDRAEQARQWAIAGNGPDEVART